MTAPDILVIRIVAGPAQVPPRHLMPKPTALQQQVVETDVEHLIFGLKHNRCNTVWIWYRLRRQPVYCDLPLPFWAGRGTLEHHVKNGVHEGASGQQSFCSSCKRTNGQTSHPSSVTQPRLRPCRCSSRTFEAARTKKLSKGVWTRSWRKFVQSLVMTSHCQVSASLLQGMRPEEAPRHNVCVNDHHFQINMTSPPVL